jgi:2-hydroxychromene-2-carboxylate isomerase
MSKTVDYYIAPQSPYTYLGHERFVAMAKANGATVRLKPMDLSKVFPLSGGLPLGKRPPQRLAYRLVELKRFGEFLNKPMNVQPKFFPVAGDDCARLIITVDLHDGVDAALRLTGAILSAVWGQERNIADAAVQAELLSECGLSLERQAQAQDPKVQALYESYTNEANDASVFGAPSYIIDGEMFWGQDRLDFVERKLLTK